MTQQGQDAIRKGIRLLVMDVDGTLTDGRIFMSAQGELCKAFYVRDGYGIKHLLPTLGIQSAIITGRFSELVAQRAMELGIEHLYQGVADKAGTMRELKDMLGLQWDEIAYIGDDLNDLPAMELAGFNACPADADPKVKEVCNYICSSVGGRGAVRELIDRLCEGADA